MHFAILPVLGFPVMNDPLYNHVVFGPTKGKGGQIGKSDDQLIQDLIAIHNAENWLGMDGDAELSMFNGKDSGASDTSSSSGGNPSSPNTPNGVKEKGTNDLDDGQQRKSKCKYLSSYIYM